MQKKKKKFVIDIKNMGLNIDKNEYREIVLSNSSHPEILGKNIKGKMPKTINRACIPKFHQVHI